MTYNPKNLAAIYRFIGEHRGVAYPDLVRLRQRGETIYNEQTTVSHTAIAVVFEERLADGLTFEQVLALPSATVIRQATEIDEVIYGA